MIYKLVADWDEININDFVKDCQNNNIDVCFDGDRAYLYDVDRHLSNLIIMREGDKTFFLKEITEKPINKFGSFVDNWICERFEQEERELIETREQEELRRMKNNIDKAREDLRKRIELARQENKTEGGADANDRTN